MEGVLRTNIGPRPLALIVDDDATSREMYAAYLSTEGVSTAQADDGFHGLAKASTLVPDIITADLHLPHLDGVEMCCQLRTQERTRHIPVIAVTGSASASEIERAKSAGCVAVLIKPCLPETLLAEIRRILDLPSDQVKKRSRPAHILGASVDKNLFLKPHADRRFRWNRDRLGERVRSEFLECPNLSLRLADAARLFALPPDACERILSSLVADGVLDLMANGYYRSHKAN